MKCVNKKNYVLSAAMSVVACAALFLVAVPAVAWAQSGMAPVQNLKEVAPVTVPNIPAPAAAAPLANEAAIDDAAAGAAFDDMPTPAMPASSMMGTTPRAGGAGAPVAPAANTGIPTAVTEVVTDLKRAEKNVTLEDVARAQDALARLDLLLDIERKINEIEKVRDERKSIGKSFARDNSASGGFGQIPASALNLPLNAANSPFRPSTPASPSVAAPNKPASPPRPSADGFKVEQITGSNGRYSAVVTDGGGKKHTVSEGEKMAGFTVAKISATGVTLTNSNDRKVLTVENDGVPMVVRPR